MECVAQGESHSESRLKAATLWNADLSKANVAGADFTGANLFEANVTCVDFSKAKTVHGANFIDAKGYKSPN